MTEASGGRAAKLPVFRTIEEGLGALMPVRRRIVLQLLVILAVTATADLLPALLLGAHSLILPNLNTASTRALAPSVASLFSSLVVLLLYVNLALAISRFVLFKEPLTVPGLFDWGRRQWRALGNLLVLFVIALVPAFAGALLTPALGAFLSSHAAAAAFLILYGLCWVWAAGWLMLMVPVIADDDARGALDRAWQISAGNRWPLIGIVLCGIGADVILAGTRMILAAIFHADLPPVQVAGYLLTAFISDLVIAVFMATSAIAYRKLTGKQAEQAIAEA